MSTEKKWTSFQRQLNLYGFHRASATRDEQIYSHPLFLQFRPHLIRDMERFPVKSQVFEHEKASESRKFLQRSMKNQTKTLSPIKLPSDLSFTSSMSSSSSTSSSASNSPHVVDEPVTIFNNQDYSMNQYLATSLSSTVTTSNSFSSLNNSLESIDQEIFAFFNEYAIF